MKRKKDIIELPVDKKLLTELSKSGIGNLKNITSILNNLFPPINYTDFDYYKSHLITFLHALDKPEYIKFNIRGESFDDLTIYAAILDKGIGHLESDLDIELKKANIRYTQLQIRELKTKWIWAIVGWILGIIGTLATTYLTGLLKLNH